MTVKELIEQLSNVANQDRVVVLQKDSEGNGYSPLYSLEHGAYRAESTWSGEVGLEAEDLNDELREQGFSEDDVIKDGVPALVLVPVN